MVFWTAWFRKSFSKFSCAAAHGKMPRTGPSQRLRTVDAFAHTLESIIPRQNPLYIGSNTFPMNRDIQGYLARGSSEVKFNNADRLSTLSSRQIISLTLTRVGSAVPNGTKQRCSFHGHPKVRAFKSAPVLHVYSLASLLWNFHCREVIWYASADGPRSRSSGFGSEGTGNPPSNWFLDHSPRSHPM